MFIYREDPLYYLLQVGRCNIQQTRSRSRIWWTWLFPAVDTC